MTRRSKKFVFVESEMGVMKSKGLATLKCLGQSRSWSTTSATNCTYWNMRLRFMPRRSSARAESTNIFSTWTAERTISRILSGGQGVGSFLCRWQANSQCRPSSREMYSLL